MYVWAREGDGGRGSRFFTQGQRRTLEMGSSISQIGSNMTRKFRIDIVVQL